MHPMALQPARLALLASLSVAATAAFEHELEADRPSASIASAIEADGRPRRFLLSERLPFAMCFAPGTPQAEAMAVHEASLKHWLSTQAEGGLAFNLTTQWSFASGPNSPITLRWSVAPDGLFIPDNAGIGSGPNQVNAKLASTFGSTEAGKELIRELFALWGDLSGVTYVEVEDDGAAWGSPGSATRGDVRIGAHGFTSANVLGYNQFPQDGDMVLNSAISWGTAADDFRFFRNLFLHEHGHGLGILHVCPANETKLMEPFLSTAYVGVQHDDIRAVQRHYGDRLEPNAGPTQATVLGGPGSTADLSPLSIADASDRDWFRFEAAAGSVLDVTATPVGFTYNSGSQIFIFCPNGSTVNSLTVHNLAMRLYASDGQTVLGTFNASPTGQPETIAGLALDAGTHYLEVLGGTASNIQLYDLAFSISEGEVPSNPADLNGDGMVDGADLAQLLGNWGGKGLGDVNGDGMVDGADLASLLGAWG
jgi:hypothetical protein